MKYLHEVIKGMPRCTEVIFKSDTPLETIAVAPHVIEKSKDINANTWHRGIVDTKCGNWLWVYDDDGIVTSMPGVKRRVRLVSDTIKKFMIIKYVGDKE